MKKQPPDPKADSGKDKKNKPPRRVVQPGRAQTK